MSIPTDFANLYFWLKASSISLNDGAQWDGSGVNIPDSSGNGRVAAPNGGHSYFRKNRIAGYPSIDFPNGQLSGCYMSGSYSREHLGVCTRFIVFKAGYTGAGSFGGTLTAGSGGNGSECFIESGGNAYTRGMNSSEATVYTTAIPCTQQVWHYAISWQDGSTLGCALDGSAETTVGCSGRSATYPSNGVNYCLNIDGGSWWAGGEIAEWGIYSALLDASSRSLLRAYLRDKYFGVAPSQVEQLREIISRRLWNNRQPNGMFDITVPQWALDLDIFDLVAIEYEKGPSAQGAGWKSKKYQRPNWSIEREEWSPGGQTVKLTLKNRAALDVLMWDTSCTDERNSAGMHSGIARFGKACGGWSYSRESLGYIDNPADNSTVVSCGNNEELINKDGEYFEEAATNILLHSSAVQGLGSITAVHPNTGDNATYSGNNLLFPLDVSLYAYYLASGNPTTSDVYLQWPATAQVAANGMVALSFDHFTEAGSPLTWWLWRDDSYHWNNTSRTWVNGVAQPNDFAAQSSRDATARVAIAPFSIGAVARTLTLKVGFKAGCTANSTAYLYHCQIEASRCVSTRIVTAAATYTRVKSQWSQPVATGTKFYDPALGGLFVQYLPEVNSADLASGTKLYLWYMTTNGGADHDACLYNVTNGRFEFERKVGASTYTAYKTATLTRGTRVAVGCRWTGVEAEWGLPQYTASIFVDKVKGTDVTTAAPTFTSPETFYRGQDSAAANQCNGALREWRFFPRPPHDDEMGRQP